MRSLRQESLILTDEGIIKVKDAVCGKKVLTVLDDVDKNS